MENFIRSADPVMPIDYMASLARLLKKRGISTKDFLEGSGISVQSIENPDVLISYSQYETLIENALYLSNEPALGLFLGQYHNITSHGLLGQAVLTSPNMEKALRLTLRYIKTRNQLIDLDVEIKGKSVTLLFDVAIASERSRIFFIESMISGICSLWKLLLGEDMSATEINVKFPAPEYYPLYEQMLKVPVAFNQENNAMRFPKKSLHRAFILSNPLLANIAEQQCEALLNSITHSKWLPVRIRQQLLKNPGQFPKLDALAEEINIHPRTLRRRLRNLNTSYQEILDDVRKCLALQYLHTTNWTIDEIAYQMGYGDPSNFRQAFKKWTGNPPSFFRRVAVPQKPLGV